MADLGVEFVRIERIIERPGTLWRVQCDPGLLCDNIWRISVVGPVPVSNRV